MEPTFGLRSNVRALATILMIMLGAAALGTASPRERKALNGLCLVIIRATAGESGKITLAATVDTWKTATITLTATPAASASKK